MAEVLNLVNPNDSLSFKYEISKFPDGQQTLRLIEDKQNYNTFRSLKENPMGIKIKSRLNNFQDLEIIICATQALKEVGVNRIRLYIPYCIGGRSDRKFMDGGINYIKHVIAPIINSQGYEEVIIMDPHSQTLENCINNFVEIKNENLVLVSLDDIKKTKNKNYDFYLVSPDVGSNKKIFDLAKSIGYTGEIIRCDKLRDIPTGNIIETIVYKDDLGGKDVIIIDDICDGGYTFIQLAKVLRQKNVGKIYLIVTHGIFSNGFDTLCQYFDGIYTTNSVKDIEDGVIVNSSSENKTIHNFVKQLNLF